MVNLTMKPLIRLQNIGKQYEMGKGEKAVVTTALHDVSCTINEGEFVAIMGQSGSGKSTLMHILGFLDVPTNGAYFFEDRDTGSFDENELTAIRSRKIGFVFQAFHLLPRTTAFENVRLPLIYQRLPYSEQKERVTDALIKVGLHDRFYHQPHELSGGQQQRVAIARALVTNPALILADEPTGNLDTRSSDEIIKILTQLHAEKHTIILVTHADSVARVARRIITLRDGEVTNDQ